jgi:hypothetical protein
MTDINIALAKLDSLTSNNTSLFHDGKKGMKWGVRRYNRAQNMVNVGQGGKGVGKKLRAYSNVGLLSLARNKGSFKKAALDKGKRSIARNNRVQSGKGSIGDKLKYMGGTRLSDLAPTSRSKSSAKSSIGAAIGVGVLLNVGLAVLKSKS